MLGYQLIIMRIKCNIVCRIFGKIIENKDPNNIDKCCKHQCIDIVL